MKKFFVSWVLWALVFAGVLTGTGCANLPRSQNYARNTADGQTMAIGQSKVSGSYEKRREYFSSSLSGDSQKYSVTGTREYLIEWYDKEGIYHQKFVNEPYSYSYSITNSPSYGRGFNWGVVTDHRFVLPHSTVSWPVSKGSRR